MKRFKNKKKQKNSSDNDLIYQCIGNIAIDIDVYINSIKCEYMSLNSLASFTFGSTNKVGVKIVILNNVIKIVCAPQYFTN